MWLFRGRRLTVGCPVVVSLLPREWSYRYRRCQPQNSFLNPIKFYCQPSGLEWHLHKAGRACHTASTLRPHLLWSEAALLQARIPTVPHVVWRIRRDFRLRSKGNRVQVARYGSFPPKFFLNRPLERLRCRRLTVRQIGLLWRRRQRRQPAQQFAFSGVR